MNLFTLDFHDDDVFGTASVFDAGGGRCMQRPYWPGRPPAVAVHGKRFLVQGNTVTRLAGICVYFQLTILANRGMLPFAMMRA